jgi:thiol-disulfide isomerase/thioredoxin
MSDKRYKFDCVSCHGMTLNKEMIESVFKRGKSFNEYVSGMSEIYRLLFKVSYDEYNVDWDSVKCIKQFLNNRVLNVIVLAAEWCPDSRQNVPALAKVAESIGTVRLSIHEVNKGDELSTKFGLIRIPTIIFYDENWNELGRIVESPLTGSIERDLEKILRISC